MRRQCLLGDLEALPEPKIQVNRKKRRLDDDARAQVPAMPRQKRAVAGVDPDHDAADAADARALVHAGDPAAPEVAQDSRRYGFAHRPHLLGSMQLMFRCQRGCTELALDGAAERWQQDQLPRQSGATVSFASSIADAMSQVGICAWG